MAENQENENGQKEAKKSSKLPLIIILVVVLGGAGAFFMMNKGGDEAKSDTKTDTTQEVEQALKSYELDTFTVNLSKPTNFLRATLQLEYDPNLYTAGQGAEAQGGEGEGSASSAKSLETVFKERDAVIRDAVINVLSSKTPDELLTQDGKDMVKEELVDSINEAVGLEEAVVTSVYFKDFVMQ